jgi:Exosome complex exonuclease Rrp40 N-terminal domain
MYPGECTKLEGHATRALSVTFWKCKPLTFHHHELNGNGSCRVIHNMDVVLPGDIVLARPNAHSTLKLGPGLLQISSPSSLSSGDDPIIATRPGLLKNIGGKQWWVERNLVRVSVSVSRSICYPLNADLLTVHPKYWRIGRWYHNSETF